METRYELTRKCLQELSHYSFPVNILTKSPLITCDIKIMHKIEDVEAGTTLTTDSDRIRNLFKPHAPSIDTLIDALKELYHAGINTFVFIGPLIPTGWQKPSLHIAEE